MQFHPTALHHPSMPRPLLSEALRGEGAVLRDEHGVAFMADEHPLADLAPRDVVSRAIARRLVDRGLDHLWLDATAIDDFPTRFPTIWSSCAGASASTRRATGSRSRRPRTTSAAASSTDLDGAIDAPGPLGLRRGRVHRRARREPARVELAARRPGVRAARRRRDRRGQGRARGRPACCAASSRRRRRPAAVAAPTPATEPDRRSTELQRLMTARRRRAARRGQPRRASLDVARRPTASAPTIRAGYELRNLLAVGWALVAAALAARGVAWHAHPRSTIPRRRARLLGRFVQAGGDADASIRCPPTSAEPSA